MLYGQDRNQLRQYYFTLWQKMQRNEALEPLQQIIAQVIIQHPEYHAMLSDAERSLHQDYLPESGQSNPFLHMGMHIAIQEQVISDRPAGIRQLYEQARIQLQDMHQLQHQIIECLAEMLWQAQQSDQPADEQAYLRCLRQRLKM